MQRFWQISPLFLFFAFIPFLLQAQKTFTIGLVSDNKSADSDITRFEQNVLEEIQLLMRNRNEVSFEVYYGDYNAQNLLQIYEDLFKDDKTDIIIGLGALSSNILAQWKDFNKPAIASLIIDQTLQQIPKTAEGTSGVENFTYIESPFHIIRDIETLYQIYSFERLVILGGANIINSLPILDPLMADIAQKLDFSYTQLAYSGEMESSLAAITEQADALYILPIFEEMTAAEGQRFFNSLNEKSIPTAALLGEQYIQQGALMGYEADRNLQRMPRRLAINVSKIIEGKNASELAVEMPIYSENLLINMAAAKKSGVYPSFDMMSTARLVNFNKIDTDRRLSLQASIVEGLQNNLGLRAVAVDPKIVEKEVALAKAELLPQVDVTTSLSYVDESQVNSSFGAIGRLNWFLSGSLSQLVFSEPVLANIAIQKLLQKSSEAQVKQNELDVILDISNAYLGVLQAESFVKIQNDNVQVTKENFDISKAKEAVGYTGATDLNRWTSELAQKNIDLNEANAQLNQAKFRLNQLLNRPIDEEFEVQDINLEDQMLMALDENITELIVNPGVIEKFADFLVEEAMNNLPELQQLDYGIAASERQKLSQKRAFYLPSLAVSGQLDRTLGRYRGDVDKDIPLVTQYSLGLGIQYPILQGGKRKLNVQKTDLNILQLQAQRADIRNQLELQIRSSMATAAASYARLELSRTAAAAAHKNFEIVQDSYSQGLTNITNLIDAQNADLQTELNAVNAIYQFVSDFLQVERSVGSYYFLLGPDERAAFVQRLTTFLTDK